jgi:hypothetical protein
LGEPRTLLVAWLGLIWSTWQIFQVSRRRKLSTKHEKLSTLIGYLVGWAVLIELVFVSQIPSPTNDYIVLVISVSFALALIWAYLGDRISKSARTPEFLRPIAKLGIKIFLIFTIVTACASEALSLYLLYYAGYLQGTYDMATRILRTLNLPLPGIVQGLPSTIYRAIASGVAGVGLGTINIALAIYCRGVLRERLRQEE